MKLKMNKLVSVPKAKISLTPRGHKAHLGIRTVNLKGTEKKKWALPWK
jgi:hypothetical protein